MLTTTLIIRNSVGNPENKCVIAAFASDLSGIPFLDEAPRALIEDLCSKVKIQVNSQV